MKTWKATLLQILLGIGAAFVPTISNPVLQKATAAAAAAAIVGVSQLNGNSDQNGNPLPPTPK